MRTLLLAALLLASPTVPAAIHDSPELARLVREDLDRFWASWDAHGGAPSAADLQRDYLQPGSPGLRRFLELRIESADALAETVHAKPQYYASLRHVGSEIQAAEPRIRQALSSLAALLPEARFPDVYFLVGRMNSGGTITDDGLLIGVDMYGRRDGVSLSGLSSWHQSVIGRPQDLVHIVAHELVHFQQAPRSSAPSLLDAALAEGVADLIGERISGRHINQAAHDYGLANECALWREFQPRAAGESLAGFLYEGDAAKTRPADTGYFIGYRIAAAYLQREGWTATALRAVLGGATGEQLLAASGYAPCPADAAAAP